MRLLGSRVLMGFGLAAASVLPATRLMAGVAIDPTSTVNAQAGDFELGGTTVTNNVTTFPYSNTTAAIDPNGTSSVLLNLNPGGFGATFNSNLTDRYSLASGQVNVLFTPSTDMLYSLAGSNAETGGALFHAFSATLTDSTTQTTLFNNDQESYNVTDETLTLGNQDGNETNALSGNLSGELIAGHQYTLNLYAEADAQQPILSFFDTLPFDPVKFSIINLGIPTSVMSGGGSVSLTLASVNAAPLPPAAWMGLATLVATGALLKFRRRGIVVG